MENRRSEGFLLANLLLKGFYFQFSVSDKPIRFGFEALLNGKQLMGLEWIFLTIIRICSHSGKIFVSQMLSAFIFEKIMFRRVLFYDLTEC